MSYRARNFDFLWGAHAPSRAGDGAFAIANLFCFPKYEHQVLEKVRFGEGAETSTRDARATQIRHLAHYT